MNYSLSLKTCEALPLIGEFVNGPSGPDLIDGVGSGYLTFLPGKSGTVAYGKSGVVYELKLHVAGKGRTRVMWFEVQSAFCRLKK